MKTNRLLFSAASVLALSCVSALAQQVTGVPGSPEATTTIDGKQLPPPAPEFGGVIKERASEFDAVVPPRVVPPKGAPDVLLIMTERCRFCRAVHFWRGDFDTGARPHRRTGARATPIFTPLRSARRHARR